MAKESKTPQTLSQDDISSIVANLEILADKAKSDQERIDKEEKLVAKAKEQAKQAKEVADFQTELLAELKQVNDTTKVIRQDIILGQEATQHHIQQGSFLIAVAVIIAFGAHGFAAKVFK
jgi:hypothetical protein